MKITVVGAGINGLSAAWALARDGHDVSVFEQAAVPNPLGSSVDQHRLIRYPYGASAAYTRMVGEAFEAWERLWRDLGETLYVRTGTLALGRDADGWTDASAATLEQLSIDARRLSASELERIFPMLRADGVRIALYLETGGVLFAQRIVASLARYLQGRGVRLTPNARVRTLDVQTATVIFEDGTRLAGDCLIVAAGAWVTRLLPAIKDRVTPTRQVVVYVDPPQQYAEHWRHGPAIMDLDGDGFYLVPAAGGTDLKIGDHRFSLHGDPDKERETSPAEVRAVLERARRTLRDFDQYNLKASRTCFYTVEPNERFIVERVGRSWVMSACSGHGFKFGALMGLAVADGIAARRESGEITAWAAGIVQSGAAKSRVGD